MAKNSGKTALEIASQGKRSPLAVLLLPLAVVGLLLFLFFSWQLIQSVLGDIQEFRLASKAESLAEDIGARAAAIRQDLVTTTTSAPLTRWAAGGNTQTALERARETFSTAKRLRLYRPNLDEIEPQPYPATNFASLDMLKRALAEQDIPPLELHLTRTEQAHVNAVAPIRAAQGNAIRGLLLVSLPLDTLGATTGDGDDDDTYLGVTQHSRRTGSGSGTVIANEGNLGLRSFGANVETVAVPHTLLSIEHAARRPLFDNFLPALLLALCGALLMGAAGYLRLKHFGEDRRQKAVIPASVADKPAPEPTADAVPPPPPSAPEVKEINIDPSIFRAYDIRGIVGQSLDESTANLIGRAIGSTAIDAKQTEIVVACDGRHSGPSLKAAMIKGLQATGINVVDIGAVPTGVLYFAVEHLGAGSGVMVTGSHNPADYNGFKTVIDGTTLAAEDIQALLQRIQAGDFATGNGGVQETDVLDEYVDRIASDVQIELPLKVVVDCGNGIPGVIAPQVLEEIGAEVETLYCDVDGDFPNHHPDPSVLENLHDLIEKVKATGADLGVAFDGDGDRLGVVSSQGEIIFADRLLMLFAEDVLIRQPGATVIYDVKCTGKLGRAIVSAGGSPLMWKTGHSFVKGKMKATKAALAGEMSGHFFFKERWYGFDDGIYAAARLLEIIAASDLSADEVFDELPQGHSTPEIRVPMAEGEHYAFVAAFVEQASFPDAKITSIDGVRADFADGWGLVRCSNTTPHLIMRFEADSPDRLQAIQQLFREQLLAVNADLDLPF